MASPAAETWKEAQKGRRSLQSLLKKLESLHKNEQRSANDEAYLEALDEALKDFRLGCMATVFTDFEFAAAESVEKLLWNAHSSINAEYRKVLARLGSKSQGQHKAVQTRQVGKLYSKFLRTSQHFYKGYVQRLSAWYPIPELERVAGTLRTEGASLDEITRKNDPKLEPMVRQSCHSTLLQLGDLARYRRQADHKSHGIEVPLLYYRLANDILPTSGFGHHQMAVVYLREKDHELQIVYHFYRALAVADVHPLASQNLELEFKKLLPGSPPRGRNASLDPKATLAAWFVRLHAHFYQGEPTPKQEELEREVLHRTQILCSTKDSQQLLFYVVLTNLAAYHVARERVEKQWTLAVSQSCQYILRFNVRVLLAISRALGKEIRETVESAAAPEAAVGSQKTEAETTKQNERFLATLDTAIPLLRIYMVWLSMHRVDIVNYAGHLMPYISEMHKSLAETLSTVIELFREDALKVGTSAYMLPEDVDTLYFNPLNRPDVANVCRAMHLASDGKSKPRLEDKGTQRRSADIETLARIHDIINCGYFLGTDPMYPLKVTQTQKGSQALVTLKYVEQDESAGSAPGASTFQTAAPVTPNKITGDWSGLTGTRRSDENSTEREAEVANFPVGVHAPQQMEAELKDAELAEADYDVDRETFNRVNEFLTPPEVQSPQSPPRVEESSSYGMNSSTANDVFAGLNSNPNPTATTPTSARAKAFPALSWDMIYQPTPYRLGTGANSGTIPGSVATTFGLPRDESGPGLKESPLAHRQQSKARGSMDSSEGRWPEYTSDLNGPASHLPNQDLTTGEGYDKARMDQLIKSASWNVEPRRLASATHSSGSLHSPRSPPSRNAARQPTPHNLAAPAQPAQVLGLGVDQAPYFQSSNFSHATASSLPQVGSPWALPVAAVRAGGTAVTGPNPALLQQHRAELMGHTLSASSASSSSQQPQPTWPVPVAATTAVNSKDVNWMDASTPWGRG